MVCTTRTAGQGEIRLFAFGHRDIQYSTVQYSGTPIYVVTAAKSLLCYYVSVILWYVPIPVHIFFSALVWRFSCFVEFAVYLRTAKKVPNSCAPEKLPLPTRCNKNALQTTKILSKNVFLHPPPPLPRQMSRRVVERAKKKK